MRKSFTMLAAAMLIAGCSREGAEGAETNNAVANAAVEAPEAEAAEPEEERNAAAEQADRPLPDYEGFRLRDEERERRLSRTYNDCMEAAGSTADYRQCSSAEFARIEVEMERALRAAGEAMSENAREHLQADQRRWREGLPDLCRRELEEEGGEGGSMDLLTLDNCSLTELIRRTFWLEASARS